MIYLSINSSLLSKLLLWDSVFVPLDQSVRILCERSNVIYFNANPWTFYTAIDVWKVIGKQAVIGKYPIGLETISGKVLPKHTPQVSLPPPSGPPNLVWHRLLGTTVPSAGDHGGPTGVPSGPDQTSTKHGPKQATYDNVKVRIGWFIVCIDKCLNN